MRPEFERAGARLAVVSAIDTGAQEFVDAVWTGGEFYIDDDETFKVALGGGTYRNWWLLKPSVLTKMLGYARRFGTSTDDVTNAKTQLLGGAFVVKEGEVVFVHHETSSFENGDARAMLAAVLGKRPEEMPMTPTQVEAVCTRETAETCK